MDVLLSILQRSVFQSSCFSGLQATSAFCRSSSVGGTVPSYPLSTYGRRALAVAGPMTCNALPTQLRSPDVTAAAFGRLLKTVMFSKYRTDVLSALEAFATKRYTNRYFRLHYITLHYKSRVSCSLLLTVYILFYKKLSYR